jgi:hypothetical protein
MEIQIFAFVGMQIMVDDQERQPQTPRTPQSSVGGLRMRYFIFLPGILRSFMCFKSGRLLIIRLERHCSLHDDEGDVARWTCLHLPGTGME